jgi:hypothetical protein
MSNTATFALSRLREIGWSQWDPIGLAPPEASYADEYDGYLMQAASKLWHFESRESVCDFLVQVERDSMGLGTHPGAHQRAASTVDALTHYIAELRGDA